MVDWENKSVNVKDDYDQSKLYFEGLVRDFKTYTQNSGDHGKKGYKSANQIADVGDEIQKYIQEIASASVASNKKAVEFAANISEESKAKDAQFQAMTAQIQALTNTVEQSQQRQKRTEVAAVVAEAAAAAAMAAAAAAAAAAAETSARSNSHATWERTVTRVATILSAATTPA